MLYEVITPELTQRNPVRLTPRQGSLRWIIPALQTSGWALGRAMIQFVVHEEGDGVGVVVVEGVKAGQTLAGWIMEDDKDVSYNFV